MSNLGNNDILTDLLQNGFRYAMSLTHNREKAEDILQDAWLAVLKANGPHEKSYLFSAIKSRFINQYRRESLVPISSIDEELVGGGNQIQGNPDVSLQGLELDDLNKQLITLRPLEREALYLSAVEGYTAQEISDHTSQPRGTVLSLIFRARNKLKKELSQTLQQAKA